MLRFLLRIVLFPLYFILSALTDARYKVNGVVLCDTKAIDEYIVDNCKLDDW